MADNTKIQWTDATWNPWHGCTKVSSGCKFCYMYRDKERYKKDPKEVIRSKSGFNKPLKWVEPRKVFTCSWSDFFIEDADQWREEAWDVIRRTPQHTYQILTKRPERILAGLPSDWGVNGYDNVWIGVSVEDQSSLHRVQTLSGVPAKVRFVSFEPLIGRVNIMGDESVKAQFKKGLVHWAIIGGESGNSTGKYRYRPMQSEWVRKLMIDLEMAGVSIFVKQLGTHLAQRLQLNDRHGGDINEWPEFFKEREFPIK